MVTERGAAGPAKPPPDVTGLPEDVRTLLDELGPRPRREQLRDAVLRLCEVRAWKPAELSRLLGLKSVGKLVERHLGPMAAAGLLRRTHPDNPAHPEQAYYASQPRLGTEHGGR